MLRSAPAVMMPQLSEAFGMSAMGVASLVGLFYYGYSPFSLVAGVAMDQFGPRKVVPIGAALVGIGSLLFATGIVGLAGPGRLLQGAGGVFALIGAAYIATTNFPPSRAATLIGATQMFGMAGGSAGQFVVGPAMTAGAPWSSFWSAMGVIGLVISVVLYLLLPVRSEAPARSAWLREAGGALATVFRNPQSLLCGFIAGLLFIPTTIFDMVWGVSYLQEGMGMDFADAVLRSATVPFGWIIGCPLLGFISDRLGRRKPVILAGALGLLGCLAWILYGPRDLLPPYLLGLATGVTSGAAMLPYTVIKEANPAPLSGTATGVVNFLNFTFSALLGPVFASALHRAAAGAGSREIGHYQAAFTPMLYGVALAVVLTLLLKETGPAAIRTNRENP
ncbi:MAG: MFS transporter [Gammaproteobacteria bacterium]|nr:MFS transporter [Gammaproteobacteria bacterium]QOJ32357.1 MAG: MFS transporter [Gammaproteobacteria bacterium]